MAKKSSYTPWYRQNRLTTGIYALVAFPIYILSKYWPKDPNLEIFGSFSGQQIGIKASLALHDSVVAKKYFVTKNRKLANWDKGILFAYGPRGIWVQVRAFRASYTHSTEDFFAPAVMGARVVALGYGVPIKQVGFSDTRLDWAKISSIRWLLVNIFPYLLNFYCNEVLSPYPFFDNAKLDMYGIAEPRILRPSLYANRLGELRRETNNRVIYAPTFRKKKNLFQVLELSGLFSHELQELLARKKLEIWIHPHYLCVNETVNIKLPNNVYWLSELELQEDLGQCLGLITDYSAVFYDAAELGVPVSFVTADLEDFLNSETNLLSWYKNLILNHGNKNVLDAVIQITSGSKLTNNLRLLWSSNTADISGKHFCT